MRSDEVVEHDWETNTCLSVSDLFEKSRYSPPTDDPVVTIPSARLRLLRKNCETIESAGRKISPVPIPIPTP
jgi:hypothetical protein